MAVSAVTVITVMAVAAVTNTRDKHRRPAARAGHRHENAEAHRPLKVHRVQRGHYRNQRSGAGNSKPS
jgi:hypothetical protein